MSNRARTRVVVAALSWLGMVTPAAAAIITVSYGAQHSSGSTNPFNPGYTGGVFTLDTTSPDLVPSDPNLGIYSIQHSSSEWCQFPGSNPGCIPSMAGTATIDVLGGGIALSSDSTEGAAFYFFTMLFTGTLADDGLDGVGTLTAPTSASASWDLPSPNSATYAISGVAVVPEAASGSLLLAGLLGFAAHGRARRRSHAPPH